MAVNGGSDHEPNWWERIFGGENAENAEGFGKGMKNLGYRLAEQAFASALNKGIDKLEMSRINNAKRLTSEAKDAFTELFQKEDDGRDPQVVILDSQQKAFKNGGYGFNIRGYASKDFIRLKS